MVSLLISSCCDTSLHQLQRYLSLESLLSMPLLSPGEEERSTCCKALRVSAAATRTSPLDPTPNNTWQMVGKIFLHDGRWKQESNQH